MSKMQKLTKREWRKKQDMWKREHGKEWAKMAQIHRWDQRMNREFQDRLQREA